MKPNATVFVGLSGGVDSSVAALRLKKQGYNVVGVFIKVWHPDFMVCNWEQERLDAMRVAAHLEIPFLTCDAEEAYKKNVADYFIAEYLAGRTPNPDVMCNQAVKFGAFMDFAKQHAADYVATGHYAQKIEEKMHRGVDINKDQTYFLWTLSNEQLSKTLFPVGNSPKEAIRKEAVAAGIPVASKKDSQGICFLGHIDIPEFISHYTTLRPGVVLSQDGDEIGTHEGALVYTLGQRHGFALDTNDTNRGGMYVVSKNMSNNTITVSDKVAKLEEDDSVLLSNIVLREAVGVGDEMVVQFRYRQKPIAVEILDLENGTLRLKMKGAAEIPATGQSCVMYTGTLCIGGGVVN